MKIKHYIVTYNNNDILNSSIESIISYTSNLIGIEYEISIINNHSNFELNIDFKNKVRVLHNELRPDFSTGHLSRNWNQAIINGFKDINNPDCDILITSQNDCKFEKDYVTNLVELHKKYSFVQLGDGDNFISYTSESIKKVGLWDERFCNIGYQEADYFLRQILYNTDGCSINDFFHRRTHNVSDNHIIENVQSGYKRGDINHVTSAQYHPHSEQIYKLKWGNTPQVHNSNWNHDSLKSLTPNIDSFIYYPYFEKNINVDSLTKQRYIHFFK